jgi:hypothetical protein
MITSGSHPAALEVEQLLRDCTIQRTRRSGPGGQHRNKVETAVVITHRPTGVQAEANERRSQAQNRGVAVTRLRVNLALEVRQPCPAPIVPSSLWQARCRSGRLAINPTHADFPALLAEALDVLAACQMDVRLASAALHVTVSQWVKFLKLEPRALSQVNAHRRESGARPLR